jgi:hypothetical protein
LKIVDEGYFDIVVKALVENIRLRIANSHRKHGNFFGNFGQLFFDAVF